MSKKIMRTLAPRKITQFRGETQITALKLLPILTRAAEVPPEPALKTPLTSLPTHRTRMKTTFLRTKKFNPKMKRKRSDPQRAIF
jgi:hypothetical protein